MTIDDYSIMLLKATGSLTDEQECLLLLHMCWQAAERTGKGRYLFHVRPTIKEQQELDSIYERMIELHDIFGWMPPFKALTRYLTYGYTPSLPKGEVRWITTIS